MVEDRGTGVNGLEGGSGIEKEMFIWNES